MKTIGIENSKSSVQAHLTLGTKTMGLGIYGAYLSRAFRRKTGLSPRDWLKDLAGENNGKKA